MFTQHPEEIGVVLVVIRILRYELHDDINPGVFVMLGDHVPVKQGLRPSLVS